MYWPERTCRWRACASPLPCPPHGWFGGVDYNFAIEMSEELRVLGATVFDVDVAGFTSQNEIYIASVIEGLKAFRPDVAVSLPNALYILLASRATGRTSSATSCASPR